MTHPRAVGPYTIEREIARGGMGVVYLARDDRLHRTVAIKSLPADLAESADRLARFEREAKALAALNHTNIAGIHSVEVVDGARYLVLEYVEGITLTQRLEQGPLAIDEALEIAVQIARGVEAAHEAGVIHRDLKPGNVIIRSDGAVKVVDFGLAKEIESRSSSLDLTKLPTVTVPQDPATEVGQVLGTPAFLSPEQARGRAVDRRTDIWSFGCVLFECLTGERLFGGETSTDSLAAILEREPRWAALPERTPPRVRELLRACLEKDPRNRLRDIGDARLTLEKALAGQEWSSTHIAAYTGAGAPRKRSLWPALLTGVVGFALGIGAAALAPIGGSSDSTGDKRVIRYSIDVADNASSFQTMSDLSISRDGTLIAYRLYDGGESDIESRRRTMVRDLDALEPWALSGLERASEIFFSPDGRRMGFQTDEGIRCVPIHGGPSTTLLDVKENITSVPFWVDDNTIARSRMLDNALVELTIGDRAERVLLDPNPENGFLGVERVWPTPDGGYLFSGWTGHTVEDYAVAHRSPEGGLTTLLTDAAAPAIIDGRYLAFLRRSTLFVAPFDTKRTRLLGDPVPVIEGIKSHPWGGGGQMAISPRGDLVYQPGDRLTTGRRLIWIDQDGAIEPLDMPRDAFFESLSVSRDGRRAVLTTLRNRNEMWLINLDTMSRERLTNRGEPGDALLNHDGSLVAYGIIPEGSGYSGQNQVTVLDTGTRDEIAVCREQGFWVEPTGWTPDGRLMIMRFDQQAKDSEIAVFDPVTGDTESLIQTEHNEFGGTISPDGRWIVYGSDRSGEENMYLQPYPPDGTPPKLITPGGSYGKAHWSADSRTVYYAHRDAMRAIDLDANGKVAAPRIVWNWPWQDGLSSGDQYAPAPDGRFLMIEPADWEKEPPRIVVVHNWIAELDERFGTRD
ncbi:MAG: protein kinase [Phycisphaeraceae bacterium]|nr:protein kinase [Phycisphaeraceae bacterium]